MILLHLECTVEAFLIHRLCIILLILAMLDRGDAMCLFQ